MRRIRNTNYYLFAIFIFLLTCSLFSIFGFLEKGSLKDVFLLLAAIQFLAIILFIGLYLKYRKS
jgi:hypothetical protein